MPIAGHTVNLYPGGDQPPLTVAAAVITIERKEESDILAGVRLGLYAQLDVTVPPGTRPHSYFLSRLVTESTWVVDALFGPNGYPYFSNGFGARYLRLRGIAWELADLLDHEARDRGLATGIGRGIPLVLAEDTESPTSSQDRAGNPTSAG
jgi:hypothetical protein